MLMCAPASRRDTRRRRSRTTTLGATLVAATVLAGCAAGSDADDAQPSPGATESDAAPAELRVATSFYALQYVTERVGGDLVDAFSLTPPGVDPHEVELSPRQVREIGTADAVVVLSGFQPPVDEAVVTRAPEIVLDVHDLVGLVPPGHQDEQDEHDDEHAHDEHADNEHGHDEHGHDAHDHDLAGLDPHFWLDPNRMVAVAHGVAATLGEAAPEHTETFAAAATELQADLEALDADYREGLARCERDVVVTGHTAFGYLARAYGFTEVGVAGIDPDNEPSPARLREIREVLADVDATTIFATGPSNASVTSTIADATGLEVGHLDPIEVQRDEDADYLDLMRENLEALRTGLGCR